MNERQRERWTPIAFCAGALLLGHHAMILSGFAVTPSDLGDTRFVHYLLEHALKWLTQDPHHADYWSPPFFAPTQGHLAWSENMLGAAWVYFPFRAVLAPQSAFQAWGLTLGVMNFFGAYLLLRRAFDFDALASSVGASLFAFSAVRINQTMHWQLFPHFYTPVAAYAAYRLANASRLSERGRVGHLALLGACAVGQLWASIYLGWFLVFVFAVGLALGLCWRRPREELWALVKGHPWTLTLLAALCVAALYPMAWRYLEVEKLFGGRPFSEVLTMLPRATTWLHLGKDSWFWSALAKWPSFQGCRGPNDPNTLCIPMEHEQRCGFGLLATALAAIAFVRLRAQARVIYVGVLLLVLLLVTTLWGDGGLTPWRVVHEYFPGAQAIRAVARASIVYMLGVSVGVAAALTALARVEAYRWAALPLGALLVLEQGYEVPGFSKADNARDIAAVAQEIEPGCDVFLMSPTGGYGPYWKYQLDAMWASMERGVPTLNGYSGQSPANWGLTDTNLRGPYDEQRVSQAAGQWLQSQPALKDKKPCWVRVGFSEGPSYGSQFVSQRAPSALHAHERADVELTFRNLGPKPWPAGAGIRLGSQAPQDNAQWGTARVELPAEVAVGSEVTFRFAVTAPQAPGKYGFQWRLVHDGVQWIGAVSRLQVIEVLPPLVPEFLAAPPDAGP